MHDHGHHHHVSAERRLGTAFVLNLAFTLLEIAGGLWTNSIAVLSDALHDLGDSLALGLSWRYARLAKREGDVLYTFGYRRFSLLGALVMSVFLLGGGIVVLWEAIPRLVTPEATNARGMLGLAIVGVLVNGAAALRMRGGHSLGERIVTWHFVEDVLGWIAVLIAALVMIFVDAPALDPALSIGITLYVLWNVAKRLRETLVILLQGVPPGVDLGEIDAAIRSFPEVRDVHHTHVWSQDGEHHVLTTHVVIAGADSYDEVAALRRRIKEALTRLSIHHATIEVESQEGPPCAEAGDTDCHNS